MKNKILICGLRNVGKTTVFWELQKQLAWPTFSVSQYLRDYVRINGLQHQTAEVIARHDDQMGREIGERTVALLNQPNPVIIETRVFEHIDQTFPNTLKVLLHARDEIRVTRNAHRESISLEKSHKRLLKRETKWLEKMHQQFGPLEFFSSGYYDLTIDTSELTVTAVVSQIKTNLV